MRFSAAVAALLVSEGPSVSEAIPTKRISSISSSEDYTNIRSQSWIKHKKLGRKTIRELASKLLRNHPGEGVKTERGKTLVDKHVTKGSTRPISLGPLRNLPYEGSKIENGKTDVDDHIAKGSLGPISLGILGDENSILAASKTKSPSRYAGERSDPVMDDDGTIKATSAKANSLKNDIVNVLSSSRRENEQNRGMQELNEYQISEYFINQACASIENYCSTCEASIKSDGFGGYSFDLFIGCSDLPIGVASGLAENAEPQFCGEASFISCENACDINVDTDTGLQMNLEGCRLDDIPFDDDYVRTADNSTNDQYIFDEKAVLYDVSDYFNTGFCSSIGNACSACEAGVSPDGTGRYQLDIIADCKDLPSSDVPSLPLTEEIVCGASGVFDCETSCEIDISIGISTSILINLEGCRPIDPYFNNDYKNLSSYAFSDTFESICENVLSIKDESKDTYVCPVCQSSMTRTAEGFPVYNLDIQCDQFALINDDIEKNLTKAFEFYDYICSTDIILACKKACEVNVESKTLSLQECSYGQIYEDDVQNDSFGNNVPLPTEIATGVKQFCFYSNCQECDVTYSGETVFDIRVENCDLSATMIDAESFFTSMTSVCMLLSCEEECKASLDENIISMEGCSINKLAAPGSISGGFDSVGNFTDDVKLMDEETFELTFSLIVDGTIDPDAIIDKFRAVSEEIMNSESTSRKERRLNPEPIDVSGNITDDDQSPYSVAVSAEILPMSLAGCPGFDEDEIPSGSQCIVVTLFVESVAEGVEIEDYKKKIEKSVQSGDFERELQEAGLSATIKLQVDEPEVDKDNGGSVSCLLYSGKGNCATCLVDPSCTWCPATDLCFNVNASITMNITEDTNTSMTRSIAPTCNVSTVTSPSTCSITPPPNGTESGNESAGNLAPRLIGAALSCLATLSLLIYVPA